MIEAVGSETVGKKRFQPTPLWRRLVKAGLWQLGLERHHRVLNLGKFPWIQGSGFSCCPSHGCLFVSGHSCRKSHPRVGKLRLPFQPSAYF